MEDNNFPNLGKVQSDLSGISDESLRSFKSFYLPSYQPPYYKKNPGPGWHKVEGRYVSEAHLRGHVAGKFSLGYPCKSFTKWAAVDIDRHNGESDAEIFGAGETVLQAFPEATPVILQSSESRGLHIFFYLPEASWSESAARFCKDRLKECGLERLEVFPMGTKNFRIPFGKGSLLLDRDFCPRFPSNVAGFQAFLRQIENGEIEPLEIPAEYRATSIPTQSTYPPRKGRRIILSGSTSPFMRDIDLLLREGLQKPEALLSLKPGDAGKRNSQTMKLNWFCFVIRRYTPEQTLKFLNKWITEKNNGLSADFNRDPAKVYAHHERIVKGFDWEKVGKGKGQKARTITRSQYRAIEQRLASLGLRKPEKALYGALLKHCAKWCDLSQEWTEVEIPREYLRGAVKNYYRHLPRLKEAGLVAEIRRENRAENRCKTYRVRCDRLFSSLATS